MTKREQISEQQVAEVVVAYLEALGADVYQEVACAGGVADIVARVQAELWIVEVKTSLSLALLLQAMERRREAHRVFVAAPYSRTFNDTGVICDELGIGLLDVRVSEHTRKGCTCERCYDPSHLRVAVDARRWNTRPVRLAAQLKPEHKTHAKAGAVGGGGRWTPFRGTCEELARIAKAEPGITLREAIEKIRHHYRTPASARSSIAHWLERRKVPGVVLRRTDTPRLYPSEAP